MKFQKFMALAGLPEDTLSIKFTGTRRSKFWRICYPWSLHESGRYCQRLLWQKDYQEQKLLHRCLKKQALCPKKTSLLAMWLSMEQLLVKPISMESLSERFCVRNSGATAVVEGIGDHGCEYMTGGVAVILGAFGRNFAARNEWWKLPYIFSDDGQFDEKKFNMEMVELEDLTDQDREHVAHLLQNHIDYAKSAKAERILSGWPVSSKKFIKVMPTDYKKALEMMAKSETEKV